MTREPVWIILPGLTMVPEEYRQLAHLLPGETRVLDSWRVSVTASTAQVRRELGPLDAPVILVGHSVGALAALEWALSDPASVERVILLDPSSPEDSSFRFGAGPRLVRGALWLATRSHPVGRRVGRAIRRRFLAGYGIRNEYLDDETVAARFGGRDSAVFVWDQLNGRRAARARVRELLAAAGRVRRLPPVHQINSLDAAMGILASRRALAARLSAELVELDAGHLFPATDPRAAFALLSKARRTDR